MVLHIIAFALNCALSMADTYQPMQMKVHPGDSIKIMGVHGTLKLIQDSRYKNLHILMSQRKTQATDWNLSVERRGSSIEIEIFSIANMAQWQSQLTNSQLPQYDIIIQGPALPVKASWREGNIEIKQWSEPVDLMLLEGNLNIKNTAGNFVIQGGRLNMTVAHHKGDLEFSADKGQLKIEQVQGKLSVKLMEGSLALTDFDGDLDWQSEKASLVSTHGSGKWNLASTLGAVQVDGFKGILKGTGDKARWRLNVAETSDVEIHSGSGPVKVRWPRGAAKAFLTTKTGGIQAPSNGKVTREEGVSKWLAQWGQGQLGQLFVNTQSGSISLTK
jgi:DUF4097 and DUF4098 domain-containing protein YvlB